MEFPGQGSHPSHSCNLSGSYCQHESLTHCARLGIEPVSQRPQDATSPIAHSGNSCHVMPLDLYCVTLFLLIAKGFQMKYISHRKVAGVGGVHRAARG